MGSQDNNHLFDYCCRYLSDTNRGGIIPAPLVAVALAGGAGSIALEIALNRISGKRTTEQDVVTAGLIGVIPGVGIAKGLGNVGRRLYSGRRILSKYKSGVTQHSISSAASAKGFGYAITSKITEAQARRNVYIYAAIGGIPAVKGSINAMIIEKSIDVIYNRKSQPGTETQRIKSSRKVGTRGARKKLPKRIKRRNGRCPNGYRYNKVLNACVRVFGTKHPLYRG